MKNKLLLSCFATLLLTAISSVAGPFGNLNATNRRSNFRDSLQRPATAPVQKSSESAVTPLATPTPAPNDATRKKRTELLAQQKATQDQIEQASARGDSKKAQSLMPKLKQITNQLNNLPR